MVQAFGNEEQEIAKFKERLTEAKKISNRDHFKTSAVVGLFLFCIFSYFAMAFYVGSVMVVEKFPNSVKIKTKDSKF